MKEIPKYCALFVDDGETVGFCGLGDTPDEAYDKFIDSGNFKKQCAYLRAAPGDDIKVYIYSCVDVKDSDWPEDERNPEWNWCLDKKLEKRIVKAV